VWYALRPPLGTTPAQIGGAVPVVTLAERVAQERDAAVAVLRRIEWSGDTCGGGNCDSQDGPIPSCPLCREEQPNGHEVNCVLAAAIGGAK